MLELPKFYVKDTILAIKDDLNYIKTEISSQEQFLENAIRSERFIKKIKNNYSDSCSSSNSVNSLRGFKSDKIKQHSRIKQRLHYSFIKSK
ncbi:hypothetical protein [Campylobacter fetus]|uniref:hypothetical protein n=1 Tax=Campylobacter fetus TaxID=196 RepID=UPI001187442C|nr:hypothetical protein [Campylobacter fetus]